MENSNNSGRRWMYWAALITLIIAIGIALATLIAPLGYRLELWDYRTGFAILRGVVPYGIYVAVAGVLIAVVLGTLSKKWQMANTTRLVGFGAIAAVVAIVTWYVPQTYLEPDDVDYPSIHDISTDTVNPPQFVAVLPLRADADNGVEYGVSRDMNPELLVQLTREAYPDLRTMTLNTPTDDAFFRALAAVETLGWDLVDANRQEGRIEATDSTFWFGFKDDIVIRIEPQGNGSRVDARSVSRVGKGDVGINAKRLRRFFEEL